MAGNLLDLDRVPTIEELREFFHKNDLSTATYRDIDYDKMDADDVEALEYIKGLMGEKWDELSRGMGLKSDPAYYGKDHPLIAMRDSMENLAATGVMKLLDEMPERAEELLSDFTIPEDWESPEVLVVKADHMLSNAVSTLMQTMNYEEIAKVIAENPAYEDFDRKWNHTRAAIKVDSLNELQTNDAGEVIELNISDVTSDVFEQVSSKLTEETFWSKLSEDDKIILLMRMDSKTQKEITRMQKELDVMRKRDLELTALFKRLYEDNVLGRIPDEHYRTLSEQYIAEQKELHIFIPKAEERMEKLKSSLTNVDRFIEKAKKYTDLTELTPEILHLFVEKIVVGEKAEKYSRTAPQDIWSHYRDIGMLNDVKAEFDIMSLDEIYNHVAEVDWDDELPKAI